MVIAAAWRYWRAARRLRRHRAEHGDLLTPLRDRDPKLGLATTGDQRLMADTLAQAHRQIVGACGRPIGGSPYLCTEWPGHDGPHRSLLREDPLPRCTAELGDLTRCSLRPGHGGLHRGTVYDRQTGRRPTSAAAWADPRPFGG